MAAPESSTVMAVGVAHVPAFSPPPTISFCKHGFSLVDQVKMANFQLVGGSSATSLASPAKLGVAPGRRLLLVKASTNGGAGPREQRKSRFGLGGPGTWFGFGRKQERQVGRLAMVGFVSGVVMEVLTGKGVLGQLSINPIAVRYPFLAGFTFLLVAGLLGGYAVINNPPDESKAPPNQGDGLPRDPFKTYDPQTLDPLTTWTRGGVVVRPSGQKVSEPYVSDLDLPPRKGSD
eukprot:c11569_g1_i1 orf=561-1259(-)